jgi:acylpyruvate hydrolase
MRFLRFEQGGRLGLAVARSEEEFFGSLAGDSHYPGDLTPTLLATTSLSQLASQLQRGRRIDTERVRRLPPVAQPRKIACAALNWRSHLKESGRTVPEYPSFFARFETTLVGDQEPLIRPAASECFDYEGEIAAVIGTGGRHIREANALDHVLGYALFNDVSVRDYQRRSSQWTLGKNFDATGAFGPYLVTCDEVPRGLRGLRLKTIVNGETVQNETTDDMVFGLESLIVLLSEVMTLEPGDVIATGTPGGVGLYRKPQVWLKAGDVCEVQVDEIGRLINPICDEALQ